MCKEADAHVLKAYVRRQQLLCSHNINGKAKIGQNEKVKIGLNQTSYLKNYKSYTLRCKCYPYMG